MDNQIEQLEGRRLLSTSVSGGTLTVTGTDSADNIVITQQKKSLLVREGSHVSRFTKSDNIRRILVSALGGNDRIKITVKLAATVDGGDGNDLIQGGAGNDQLTGGNGNDRILGNGGNDSISGDAGRDNLFGGAGDDMIDAYDTQADQLTGGGGNDKARVDTNVDTAWNVEGYLAIESNNLGMPISVASSGTLSVNGAASSFSLVKTGAGTLILNNSAANLTITGGQMIDISGAGWNANATGATLPFDGIIDYGRPSSTIGLVRVGEGIYIRPTHVGDFNLDGLVTIADFIDLAAANFNTVQPITPPDPSLNPDQNVTISDFIDLAANFNSSSNLTLNANSTLNLNASSGFEPCVPNPDGQPIQLVLQTAAPDPVVLTAPELPAVDESTAQPVVEVPASAPLE